MKKISTYFKKDPNDLSRVIPEVSPENNWVSDFGVATRKYDGTSCAIINGEIYKRFDAKIDKSTGRYKDIPEGAIPCQEPDEKSGHYPHWVKCYRDDSGSKYHFEGFDNLKNVIDGTYELCGPKINGNKEHLTEHILIPHGHDVFGMDDSTYPEYIVSDLSYNGLKNLLGTKDLDVEGIVFHHLYDNTKMCKIRKCDFGFKR